MLVPAGVHVLTPEGWGVIISFSEDGYVKDDDAAKIASMDRLESVKRDMAKVMGFVEFNGGHRYTDFIPGTDKVAEYGIAAAAFLRKLFGRKPTDAAAKP